jgi:hypothetical protein
VPVEGLVVAAAVVGQAKRLVPRLCRRKGVSFVSVQPRPPRTMFQHSPMPVACASRTRQNALIHSQLDPGPRNHLDAGS